MKLKPRAQLKPGECCVLDCPLDGHTWGFCVEHRAELAAAFERNIEASRAAAMRKVN